MKSYLRHAGMAVAAALLSLLVLRSASPAALPPSPEARRSPASVSASPVAIGTPVAASEPAAPVDSATYAIGLVDLPGLPPDAMPGTALDLWVSWEPPLVEVDEIGIQPLLRGVMLERIVPPVTPEGPYVALLSLARKRVPDLLNADRYGSISVTVAGGLP